jgi:hypothetical protein
MAKKGTVPPPSLEVPQAPGSAPVDAADGLAVFLMKKSGVPEQYQTQLHPYVVEQIKEGRKLPDPHKDDRLMMLAKHTCTKDWITRAFSEFSSKPADYQDAVKPGFFSGVGLVLGHGFDKSEGYKFTKDPAGRVTGIRDPRQATCNAALAAGEVLYGGRKRKTIKKKSQKKHKTLRRRKMGRDMH